VNILTRLNKDQRVMIKFSPTGKTRVGTWGKKGVRSLNKEEVSDVVAKANVCTELLKHLGDEKVYQLWQDAIKANIKKERSAM
jgi:hypothetical protein